MQYKTSLNPIAYKNMAKYLNEMGEKERGIYLEGVFNVISTINNLAKGGALEKEQRLALDIFYQWLEMGITPEQFKRLGLNVAGMEIIGEK